MSSCVQQNKDMCTGLEELEKQTMNMSLKVLNFSALNNASFLVSQLLEVQRSISSFIKTPNPKQSRDSLRRLQRVYLLPICCHLSSSHRTVRHLSLIYILHRKRQQSSPGASLTDTHEHRSNKTAFSHENRAE